MNGKRITTKTVGAALAGSGPYFLWDSDLKGFGLKVFPSGTKTFVIQYRTPSDGKTKRRTIGKFESPWSAKAARDEAARLLHLVGLGHDLSSRSHPKSTGDLPALFSDYSSQFLRLYAARNWAPRTIETHRSNIERWLIPILGKVRIDKIDRSHVTKVLDQIGNDKPALPRNLFVLMRTMFNWAVDRGDLEKSPMNGMRRPAAPPERHHILSDDEVIVVALVALKMGRIWGGLIHMLLWTGQRLREVAEADWSEFDQSNQLWTIPAARTKNRREHVVPLNDAACSTLSDVAGGKAWPASGFVFTHKAGIPVSGFSRMKRRLDMKIKSAGEGVRPWRLHDLRRTVATNMQRLGVRFEVTEAILNHVSTTQSGVASVYQRHDWAEEKREAMNSWGVKMMEPLDRWAVQKGFNSRELKRKTFEKTF